MDKKMSSNVSHNVSHVIDMAMCHIVQKHFEYTGKEMSIASLERYLTYCYEMANIDDKSPFGHYDKFVAKYLLDNMSDLITNGWMDDIHTICNDMSTNNDINMEMI